MKKMKKLVIAALVGMLGLVGATTVTSGLAWFTASSTVQVSGMTMKAQAEQGIVISNEDAPVDGKKVWKTSATASHTGAALAFVPTSTHDASTWVHAYADDMNNGQSGVVYSAITPVDNITTPSAMGTADDGAYGFNENGTWKRVYLLNSFYIQSSSTSAIANQSIYLKDLTATASSQELSKALRVVVKHGANSLVFAPITTATTTYQVCTNAATNPVTKTSTTAVLASATAGVDTNVIASGLSIPAYAADGASALQFDVYAYYEGEDAACKSANIEATFDTISISFTLGNKQSA